MGEKETAWPGMVNPRETRKPGMQTKNPALNAVDMSTVLEVKLVQVVEIGRGLPCVAPGLPIFIDPMGGVGTKTRDGYWFGLESWLGHRVRVLKDL